jgi:hypothetical protein
MLNCSLTVTEFERKQERIVKLAPKGMPPLATTQRLTVRERSHFFIIFGPVCESAD